MSARISWGTTKLACLGLAVSESFASLGVVLGLLVR